MDGEAQDLSYEILDFNTKIIMVVGAVSSIIAPLVTNYTFLMKVGHAAAIVSVLLLGQVYKTYSYISNLRETVREMESDARSDETVFEIQNEVDLQYKNLIILLGGDDRDRMVFDLMMIGRDEAVDYYWGSVSTQKSNAWSDLEVSVINGSVADWIRRDIDRAARYLLKISLDTTVNDDSAELEYKIDTEIDNEDGQAWIDIREPTGVARVLVSFPEDREIVTEAKRRDGALNDGPAPEDPNEYEAISDIESLNGFPADGKWLEDRDTAKWIFWESTRLDQGESYYISWQTAKS